MTHRLARAAGSALAAVAAAVTILAIAVLPFLNPAWVAFAQDRAEATAWTGYSTAQLRAATDALLVDLVLGPPEFDVAVAGEPVLNARERGHMTDVRSVFAAFALVAGASVVGLAAAVVATRRRPAGRLTLWRAARRGAVGLAVATGVVGLVGVFAFELAFEAFHRLFFDAGTYTFDPRTERLVQLFPQRFWSETSIAVGIVMLLLAAVLTALASRRLRVPQGVTGAIPVLGTAR